MEYFIFDYTQDISLIESFLSSAATAHGEPVRTRDWFLWKFSENPFGESILACAKENDEIVGCVALGMQDFVYDGNVVKAALSFETFVHPAHQGKGIFKKLINLAETEAKQRKIVFLLNFPNSQSLPGFIKSGWTNIHCAEYWIKPKSFWNLVFNVRELKKGFVPNVKNSLRNDFKIDVLTSEKSSFKSVINEDYIYWRFLKFPAAEYAVIQQDSLLSIGRVGRRGSLKEVQVLLAVDNMHNNISVSNLFKLYKNETSFDILSFPISIKNQLRKKLQKKLFIKVPTQTNVTFKIIGDSYNLDFSQLELSAINYHTY